jgi:hypothetical protein
MSANPDLAIETDASKQGGGSMSHSKFKDGRTLESCREEIAYQCTGIEGSTVGNSINDKTRTEYTYSHKIRQHNNRCLPKQNGGNEIRTTITNNKTNLDSLSVQNIMITAEHLPG